ncbi:MAG TPA: hypothetical protein VGP98_10650, partial [Pyrinomonadaceae bacterium]|nr:hypothetical protein [Pyrinomonadaceae bacterium]
KHWRLEIDGAVAKLSMDVQEDETLADGYSSNSILTISASISNSPTLFSDFASSIRTFASSSSPV